MSPRPESGSSRHNNRRWHLTPERMAHINASAAQSRALSAAASELGVHPATIKAAAEREGKMGWLQARFNVYKGLPARPDTRAGCLRTVSLSALGTVPIPPGPQVEWLTRA